MTNDWQESYRKLRDFTAHNPSIEISPTSVCVPGNVREEFYRLFDGVNNAFITGRFPGELAKADLLSRKWSELAGEVKDALGLKSIDVSPSTRWFLDDPLDGLNRTLFDPLFDLLKGKMEPEVFEGTAMGTVRQGFDRFYREGYQRWVTLALIKLLAPDRMMAVPTQDIYNEANLADSGGGAGTPLSEPHEPEDADIISFVEAPVHAFLTPKIIVRSTRLKAFVSLRPDFHESSWNSRIYSERQEWLDIDKSLLKGDKRGLWPDLVIHIALDPRDLALTADYSRIARPEAILEVREDGGWFEKEGLEPMRRHAAAQKPKRGCFAACCEQVPPATLEELKAAAGPGLYAATGAVAKEEAAAIIRLLYVDYDPARLEPVVEALTGTAV